MKKNLFILFIAAAAMMGSMLSCEKEDTGLPEVIESEVLESGMDKKVTAVAEADGSTSLSYESWIMVRQITRSGDNRFSVMINNKLENVVKDIQVEDYNFGKGFGYPEYVLRGSSQEGYVTRLDSVLRYTVKHDNFEFSYELPYEVPVYDDGVTRQTMPYYRYENIVDKGYKVTDMPSREVDGKAYACKLYEHYGEVTFNGEVYSFSAAITLMRYLGPANQPYLLKSELVTAGTQPHPESLVSTIGVKHTWSTGQETTDEYSVALGGYIESQTLGYVTIHGYRNDLQQLSSSAEDIERNYLTAQGDYISCYRNRQKYSTVYNYLSVYVELVWDEGYFDDGLLQCRFPGAEITDVACGEYVFELRNSGVDEESEYDNYWLTHQVTAKFGETPISGIAVLQVVSRP